MNLVINLDTGELLNANLQLVTALSLRYKDQVPLALRFYSANAYVEPTSVLLVPTVKASANFDGTPLCPSVSFTQTGTGSSAVWTGLLTVASTDIATLLLDDGNAANDVTSVSVNFQLYYEANGGLARSAVIPTTLYNSLYRGTETFPSVTAGTGLYQYAEIVQVSNFTAVAGRRYATTATLTVTDPASPSKGQFYEVRVSAGTATIGGTAYSTVNQRIIRTYNGGAWSNVVYVTDADTLSATAALIEREGLRFDGSAGAVISNGGIPAVGTGDFTAIFSLNPGTINADLISGATNALGLYYNGTAFGANKVYVSGGASISLSLTAPAILAYARASGMAQVYLNGVAYGSAQADASNYSVASTALMMRGDSTNFSSGSIAHISLFNYALTAAEIAALTRRGLVTLPEQRGGSMTALNTVTAVNWVASPYTTFSGASSTGFTATQTTGTGYAYFAIPSWGKGRQYRVSFTLTLTSGSLPSVEFNDLSGARSNTVTATAGVNSFVLTAVNNSTPSYANVIFYNSTSTSYAISSVSIIPLGTTFEQDSGQRNAGYMVRDTSGNHANLILPASGVSIIDPAKGGIIEYTTTTNGNQQLGGSQVIIPTNARITSWVINSSGTPTISLGNVSGGAQFVSALVLAATAYNDVTLLTRFCTTGNLWCSSNSTATLKHTIQWEYIQ